MSEPTPDVKLAVPASFLPYVYISDPETEDLIFGDALADGMIVAIEDTHLRANPDRLAVADPDERLRILETARWCRVEKLRTRDYGNVTVVTFIAEYSDGSKISRLYNLSLAWYVKKASIPS